MSQHKVLQRFVNDSLIKYEEQQSWTPQFRGSSLPVCPRQLMLGKFHQGMTRTSTFVEQYHMTIGTAIHSLIQATWCKQGVLWGDWQCKNRDCGEFFENQYLSECPHCHGKVEYLEKVISDPEFGFSGHCDGVVRIDALDGHVIAEIKSRNFNIIKDHENSEPFESDKFQVSAYATLLSRSYPKIKIVGRMILWVGKPRPAPFGLWFYPGLGEDLYESQIELYAFAQRKLAQGKPLSVPGRCEAWEDVKHCPFGGICFSARRDDLINELYQESLQKPQ